ncbi:hypothetical protein Patl1_23111 [Pistacia atlantica]|uniref:Uncharacterized protein n=1 Tax=Pistacia atlantica TaxID=434234 RepID=A0ACC0ZY21_9ROSI|nr:hypothetical protein Patl1_23111 [Pistacia atlantica]
MVVLVSDGVSGYAKKLLQADGWKVEEISLLTNPNQVRPKRFWGVYTKLKIFNMTNYRKVVYLDADTIVVKNIEDLFRCRKFCANLKHSERLNSGVMVVEPSKTVFNDMMSKVNTLHSYTGGDQGFLNSYYPDFPNAHVFEPNLSPEMLKSRPVPDMERLSTLYNADVGLYMLANKWMVNETGTPCYSLYTWNVRIRLEETLPGTGGGGNPNDDVLVKVLFLLPLCALLFCYYRSFLQIREHFGSLCRSSLCDQIRLLYFKIRSCGALAYTSVSSSSAANSNHHFSNGARLKVPGYLGGISILRVLYGCSVVPWPVFCNCASASDAMDWFAVVAFQAGSSSSHRDSFDDDSGKGHQRQTSACDFVTWYYGIGMAFLAVAVPSLPFLFGITALFLRQQNVAGCSIDSCNLLVIMISVGIENLSYGYISLVLFDRLKRTRTKKRSFLRGLEDQDSTRPGSACFLC